METRCPFVFGDRYVFYQSVEDAQSHFVIEVHESRYIMCTEYGCTLKHPLFRRTGARQDVSVLDSVEGKPAQPQFVRALRAWKGQKPDTFPS